MSSTTTPAEPEFIDLGLSDESLEILHRVKYLKPSPIQAAIIPIALTGQDCIGQARTGTGKTAAFALPLLERIDRRLPGVQAIILTPTRELSDQVAVEVERLGADRGIKTVCCVGGKRISSQIELLRRGAQVVIGTPGRVIDLMNRGLLNLATIRIVVLDEADRMLDIGFRPDIERILRRCPEDRQTLLLSATLPPPVERLARKYMRDPAQVDLSQDQVAVDTVEQYYVPVEHDQKLRTLVRLLCQVRPRQVIVFCRTKRGADKLSAKLLTRLPKVAVIHGDLAQTARDRALKDFRSGDIRMLIATDVVGRGIDVSSISHIINYDMPQDCDDYVHRIGRTGRMSGDRGYAFTFVTSEEGKELTNVEKRINMLLPSYKIDLPPRSYRERVSSH